MANTNGPRVEFGNIIVTKVVEGMSKGSDIAVLSQPVRTIYPSASAGNDKVDSLFGSADFGDGQSYESKRPAIIKVPKGTAVAAVIAKIDALENPRIYRILSFNVEDVLTDDQKSMVAQGLSSMTMEQYKEDKAVKNGETGEKVLMDGKVQYRSLFFSTTPVEDIDNREVTATSRTTIAVSEEAIVEEGAPVIEM